MLIYNQSQFKHLRRNLRINQTEAERKIWSILRNKQILGLRFLRQYGVENYILDFYCPAIKLAVEIDGGQHNGKGEKLSDDKRTKVLELYNIQVLRFWNNEVIGNLEGVYQKIMKAARDLTPPSLPFKERGGSSADGYC